MRACSLQEKYVTPVTLLWSLQERYVTPATVCNKIYKFYNKEALQLVLRYFFQIMTKVDQFLKKHFVIINENINKKQTLQQ